MATKSLAPALVFEHDLAKAGLTGYVKELTFHEPRKAEKRRLWRFDYAWPALRLAVEIEGGTWSNTTKSRHTTATGYARDCLKYSTAAIQGWMVVRVDSKMVTRGHAALLVARAIEAAKVSADARALHGGH